MYNTFGIYGIVNKQNGKIYVGKTTNNFGDRRDCHFASYDGGYGCNPELQREWDQYGRDAFDFIVLEECPLETSKDEIDQLEIDYIKKFKDAGIAYNIADGGDTSAWKGKHLTEEMKRKIGEKNRVNMLGRTASDKTKAKMSESQRRRYQNLTEEEQQAIIERLRNSTTGKKWDEERRQKYSDEQKTNPHSAKYDVETVHKIREMHEVENKSYKEISEMLNIPKHTVYLIATYRRWKYV